MGSWDDPESPCPECDESEVRTCPCCDRTYRCVDAEPEPKPYDPRYTEYRDSFCLSWHLGAMSRTLAEVGTSVTLHVIADHYTFAAEFPALIDGVVVMPPAMVSFSTAERDITITRLTDLGQRLESVHGSSPTADSPE